MKKKSSGMGCLMILCLSIVAVFSVLSKGNGIIDTSFLSKVQIPGIQIPQIQLPAILEPKISVPEYQVNYKETTSPDVSVSELSPYSEKIAQPLKKYTDAAKIYDSGLLKAISNTKLLDNQSWQQKEQDMSEVMDIQLQDMISIGKSDDYPEVFNMVMEMRGNLFYITEKEVTVNVNREFHPEYLDQAAERFERNQQLVIEIQKELGLQ